MDDRRLGRRDRRRLSLFENIGDEQLRRLWPVPKKMRRAGRNLPVIAGRHMHHRPAPFGLVHQSDRGVQYACADYTRILDDHRITVSMSRPGNPYDNAKAESS